MAWKPGGVPWDYAQADLPTDLERIQDYIMEAIERVPLLGRTGMKHIVNGPITYTPDSNQLLGPVYGAPNFFCMAGCNFGITQAGGVGRHLAEWIVEGEPGLDLWSLDPRRFGRWTSRKYTLDKVHEAYRMQYGLSYPDEERPAGRPIKTSPVHDLLASRGAVFGSRYGWERPNWFAPPGVEPVDRLTFRRHSNYFEHVGEECRAARDRAAVYELSGFSKFEVSGPGAEAWLDRLLTGSLPREGRAAFNLMVSPRGRIEDDLTVSRIGPDRFYLVAAAPAELRALQWMERYLPADGSVTIENVTYRYGVLAVIGPRSREILAGLTETDLTNEAFPYLAVRDIHVGAAPVRAVRIDFAGELGWELHHPIEYQRAIYLSLLEAGRDFGLADCGLRALLNSMRLEKGYCLAPELSAENTPLEAGLEAFVKFDKGDFIGREALLRQRDEGLPDRLVSLTVEADDADAYGDEPVYCGGEVVGRVTSGGYGHRVDKSMALAYVRSDLAEPGESLEVEILARRFPATVVRRPYYDPENKRIRD